MWTCTALVVLVINCPGLVVAQPKTLGAHPRPFEYPPYDGWYNNLAHPDWAAAETQLFRRVPPAYCDGVYEPAGCKRPNPIDISDIVFQGNTGLSSYRNRTAFLVFFGQQVVEEFIDAQRPGCPPEYFNIPVPKCHRLYDKECKGNIEVPLLRSRYDSTTGHSPNSPRMQLNEISAYIDGTLMYGSGKAWTDALRSFKGGRLATFEDKEGVAGTFPAKNTIKLPMANPPPPRDHFLKPVSRFYRLGNPRGNENTFLLTFGIMWFRYHNWMADHINNITNGKWTDEEIFNEARKWVIATDQKIVMYDWIPAWLTHGLDPYPGYDPTTNAAIAHVFQTSAMRFGHTLVPPGAFRRSKNCTFYRTTSQTDPLGTAGGTDKMALRTCNAFWNPQEGVNEHDIDALLMGMASQVTEREDTIITGDLRDDVFGPLEFSRRPLMAINIQRARDHGVPDYNTVREHFNLTRHKTIYDINPDFFNNTSMGPEILTKLNQLYGNSTDNLDLWPMGIIETTADGPGPTFRAIILDQFRRMRNGDRFWFENRQNGLFTDEEIAILWNVTIKDIVMRTTNIEDKDIQDNPFHAHEDKPCPRMIGLTVLNETQIEKCTPLQHFDYFTGSGVAYALSFAGLIATLPITIGVLLCISIWRDHKVSKQKSVLRKSVKRKSTPGTYTGLEEWVSHKQGFREVRVHLDSNSKQIRVKDSNNKILRTIDIKTIASVKGTVDIVLSADNNFKMIQIKFPKEYDLVLRFDTSADKDVFHQHLAEFISTTSGVGVSSPHTMSEKQIKAGAFTKERRQKDLDLFFREVFAQAFNVNQDRSSRRRSQADVKVAEQVTNLELTRYEFCEALGLTPDSMFIRSMFEIVDKDNNGFISFREFLDLFIILSKGSPEDKAKLLFDMYDLDGDGVLKKDEFETMIRSMLELANDHVDERKMSDLIKAIYSRQSGVREQITLKEFNHILSEFESDFNSSRLMLNVEGAKEAETKARAAAGEAGISRARKTVFRTYRSQVDDNRSKRKSLLDTVGTIQQALPPGKVAQYWLAVSKFMSIYRLEVFWFTLYTLVTIGIFVERAYFYSVEREEGALRRITSYGVSITRGAASGMMFTYTCLLITMCRNCITYLRETFLHRYIPFDSAITLHKFIAWQAAFYTLIHCIGHAFNFYHIPTQTADDLSCLFRNYHHATDVLPKFTYWAWDTITGCTGFLATIVCFIIYTFAVPFARRYAYQAFWITHHFFIILYILMFLHGAGRLVQAPYFHFFFMGPVILYIIDKLISVGRKKVELAVIDVDNLPSEVTKLVIQKPGGFDYRSGQWVRIACLAHNNLEYHPFTLTSAPHEPTLSLHIRAVGPWTMSIRNIYDKANLKEHALPRIYLDGPYGEGHQDWYRYEVVILVGGGIGVTPFASILKDITYRLERGETIACKRVYFVWVTRDQRSFEWMMDILREVEDRDIHGIVSAHIFVTQFKEKYDFRTTMLYVCERYFQKISLRSLFTGLRAITHFGRPDFKDFLHLVQGEHPKVEEFGVFSCGPPPMTSSVDKACQQVNSYIIDTIFSHHFENF